MQKIMAQKNEYILLNISVFEQLSPCAPPGYALDWINISKDASLKKKTTYLMLILLEKDLF